MSFSLRSKVVSLIIALCLIVAAIAAVISYITFAKTVDDYYKDTITNVAETAAKMMDAEIIGDYAVSREMDDEYQEQFQILKDIKESNKVTYLYVEKIIGTKAIAIMDVDEVAPMGFRETFDVSDGADTSDLSEGIPAFISNEPEVGWMCSVFYPITNEAGEVVALVGADISMDMVMNERYTYLTILCIAILIDVLITSLLMIHFVNKMIVNPINKLAKATSTYVSTRESGVEMDEENSPIASLEIKSKDEIGNLTASVKTMEQEINQYIDNLTKVTAEKERIGAELDVATNIQASMLPSTFPAYPNRDEFDIYASMNPAKEVGGDFYDFFFVDDDHFAMVMADVSGKGVPAALFMVIAKTLIKNCAQTVKSPKEILEKVNKQLCENNDAEMFVTVWLGIIEISTGKLKAANAGHEYPVIKRANEKFELIRDKHGFVLAGMEFSKYTEYEINMNKGDFLYLYTDGVPESTNSENELFGVERMLEALNNTKDAQVKSLLENVRAHIDDFVQEAPQFDDITMLSFCYNGATKKETEEPAPDIQREFCIKDSTTADINSFVEESIESKSIDMRTTAKLMVAVDEIGANIMQYSGAAYVKIGLYFSDAEVKIRFEDDGVLYNPLDKDDPDVTLSAEERSIGGLGIYMVKKSMDNVEYFDTNGKNILIISKKLN